MTDSIFEPEGPALPSVPPEIAFPGPAATPSGILTDADLAPVIPFEDQVQKDREAQVARATTYVWPPEGISVTDAAGAPLQPRILQWSFERESLVEMLVGATGGGNLRRSLDAALVLFLAYHEPETWLREQPFVEPETGKLRLKLPLIGDHGRFLAAIMQWANHAIGTDRAALGTARQLVNAFLRAQTGAQFEDITDDASAEDSRLGNSPGQ